MYEIRQTVEFQKWLRRLPDRQVRARVVRRIERLASGNAGDQRFLGAGLYELREHAGPGYRVYFSLIANRLILLLVGGDKGSQKSDIARARAMILTLETGK